MKKWLCILIICFLFLSGFLYILSGYRSSPEVLTQNRVATWKENINNIWTEKREEITLFDNLSDERLARITTKTNIASSLINSWMSHIKERVEQYGK